MSLKNGKRRLRRLPLSLAMAGAMSIGSMCMPVAAEDARIHEAGESQCMANEHDCRPGIAESATAASSGATLLGGGWWSSGPGIGFSYISTYPAVTTAENDIAFPNGRAEGTLDAPAIAIGQGTTAAGSVAIGELTTISTPLLNAAAIGARSETERADTVSFGNSTLQRRIMNAAAGAANTDAVIVGQLSPVVANLGGSIDSSTGAVIAPTYMVGGTSQPTFAQAVTALDNAVNANNSAVTLVSTQLNDGAAGLVRQSTAGANVTIGAATDGAAVDFAGTAGARKLTGIAAEELTATSSYAVNGAQLYAVDEKVGGNTNAITIINSILSQFIGGGVGLVLQDASTQAIRVAATTGGTSVNVAGTAGDRVLEGVAGETAFSGSTKAMNGAQLYAVERQIASIDGRVSKVFEDIVNIQRDIADLGPIEVDGLTYDDASKGRATLQGSDGTLLTNLAPALIAAGSTDAVNGGRLFDVNALLEGQIGDLDARAGDLEEKYAAVEKDIADGTLDPGHFDGDAKGEPISGVAPGLADTDGVNVGQLNQLVDEAIKQAKGYTDQQATAFSRSLDGYKKEVHQRFKRQDERIDRIGAMGAASTHMAINASGATTERGRLAVGAGAQNGKGAMAVGYGRPVGERTYFSAGGSFSGPERSAGVGLSVSF